MSKKRRKISKGKEEVQIRENKVFKESTVALVTDTELLKVCRRVRFLLGPKWCELGNDERVKKIEKPNQIDEKKEKSHYKYIHPHILNTPERILEELLSKIHYNKLKKFYSSSFPSSIQRSRLSKTMVIQEIINRYTNKIGDVEKRMKEKKNVEKMLEYDERTQEFQFQTLCNVLVPVDIVKKILSFLRYNKNMLFMIGKVNKFFYITILSSWPHITITKSKVFQVSILVLRSVRSVTFKQAYYSNENLLQSEFGHVFSHLNPARLRSIRLDKFRIKDYVKFLRYLCRKKDKSSFQNVISFDYRKNNYYNIIEDFKSYIPPWKGIQLKRGFPNLQKICNPLNFQILEGLEHLNSITINLLIPRKFDKNISRRITPSLGLIGTDKRDRGLPKERIRELKFVFHCDDLENISNIPKFLQNFKSLNRLILESHSSYLRKSEGKKCFDISLCLSPLNSSLSELVLDCWSCGKYFPWKFPNDTNSFDSFLPHLTVLKFGSAGYNNPELKYLIFCLSSSNLKELDISVRMTPKDGESYTAILTERFHSKLFSFERLNIELSWDKKVDGLSNMSGKLRLVLRLKLVDLFKNRKIDKPTLSIELSHFFGRYWDRKNYVNLGEFCFLRRFLEMMPSLVSKYPSKMIELVDKSFRCCRFIDNNGIDIESPVDRTSLDKKMIIDSEICRGTFFYTLFNKGMEEEDYNIELKRRHDENELNNNNAYKSFEELYRVYCYTKKN